MWNTSLHTYLTSSSYLLYCLLGDTPCALLHQQQVVMWQTLRLTQIELLTSAERWSKKLLQHLRSCNLEGSRCVQRITFQISYVQNWTEHLLVAMIISMGWKAFFFRIEWKTCICNTCIIHIYIPSLLYPGRVPGLLSGLEAFISWKMTRTGVIVQIISN